MASASFCEQPTDYVSKVLSEKRKAKKPLMEKMRRARINDSLNELKSLILEALNKDASRYSKMEKADVLEMTVHYLRELRRMEQKHQDASSLPDYRAGFVHCAADLSRKLTSTDSNDQLRANFLGHLASRCQGNGSSTVAPTSVIPVLSSEGMKYMAPLKPVLIPFPSPPPSPHYLSPVSSAPTSPTRDVITPVTSPTRDIITPVTSPTRDIITPVVFMSALEPKLEKPASSAPLWRPW